MDFTKIKDSDGNTAAHYWAKGGMWLLIWLGFGGCCMMANRGSDKSLVEVVTQPPAVRSSP